MDISCDIIRDLLPLYAENLTSKASNDLVDKHLCECDDCTKQLGILKKAQVIPVDVEVKSLKRVGDTIRRRKVLTVIAALMTAVSLFVTCIIYLMTPYILTATEAIEDIWVTEDGALAIDYARGVIGKASMSTVDEDNNANVCYTTRYDWYEARQTDTMLESMSRAEIERYIADLYDKDECTEKDWNRFFDIDLNYGNFQTKDGEFLNHYDPETWTSENGKWMNRPTERNQWYIQPTNSGVDMHLMYDAGLDLSDSILWQSSNVFGYLLLGCLGVAALCFWIARGVKEFWKEILYRAVIILVSIAISTLLVTNGNLRVLEHYLTYEWNQAISTEALVLSLTALFWHQLHRLKGL